METVISVDGPDGSVLARSRGIRHVSDESQALVLRDQRRLDRNGRPGTNTPEAIPGGPAGTLVIQLSESNLSQGAICVQRRENNSAHQLPASVEVPVGRNIRITAIGGKGENGKDGGNGEQGLDGGNGTDASEADDATDGTNGGRGGDAGQGSNGGDGGSGGYVDIIVNENNTHLLMAVSWDVRGGTGGNPGKHGNPGSGGKGGKGGQGWRWEKIIGYKPYCTDNCIKSGETAASSNAIAKATTHLSANTNAIRAQTQALVVRGNSAQALIAQAAIKYNAMRTRTTDTGYCKCGGGTGSCQGCDVKPIRVTLTRAPGLDGKAGEKGRVITSLLAKGKDGNPGEVVIAVQHQDGTTQQYSKAWSLQLIDFDIEDENQDGIFEPGEHLFIRRIRLRNTGGMPSPTCRIPVTIMEDSEWFERLPGAQGGVTYLPTNIPAGESASTEGSIKVRIKYRDKAGVGPPAYGHRFTAKDTIRLRADMPWLDRQMPHFEFCKEIQIGYPCGLSDFEYLDTIGQGATSKINYKVNNCGNRPLGSLVRARAPEVRVTIPANFGRLSINNEAENGAESIYVPHIRSKDTSTMQQQFRILSDAKNHKHFHMIFELWLEVPGQDPTSPNIEKELVERHAITLQVSSTYVKRPNAEILLVTNRKTSEQQSSGIQQFVRETLGLELDVCNIHQNGGLLTYDESLDIPKSLITHYRRKGVLFLDDPFDFYESGLRSTSQLCDPEWISELASSGSSISFVGCKPGNVFESLARYSIFLARPELENAITEIDRSRNFPSKEELLQTLIQEKQYNSAKMNISIIPLPPRRWYQLRRNNSKRQAQKLVAFLNTRLPNDRFLVSYSRANKKDRALVILTGLGHNRNLTSAEYGIQINPDTRSLDALSRYNILATFPFQKRSQLLWRATIIDTFVVKALVLSISRTIFEEVIRFTESAHRSLYDIDTADAIALKKFFKTHLPEFEELLCEEQAARVMAAPEPIQEVLQYVLRFTARHKRLDHIIRSMIAICPSLYDLRSYICSQPYDQDALIHDLSELTQTPNNLLVRGVVSGSNIIPRTVLYTPQEWSQISGSMRIWKERIEKDMDGAKRQLDRMLVETEFEDELFVSELGTP